MHIRRNPLSGFTPLTKTFGCLVARATTTILRSEQSHNTKHPHPSLPQMWVQNYNKKNRDFMCRGLQKSMVGGLQKMVGGLHLLLPYFFC